MSRNPISAEQLKANFEPVLRGKKILLGVTGSISAYKSLELIRALRACGAEVQPVLTKNGAQFVTPLSLQNLSGKSTLTEFWENPSAGTVHIDTARWADALVVAPASANFIAKLANGLADDLLSTEALAFRGPVLIAPAMNPSMFSNPATQENIQRLRDRDVQFSGPSVGATACGEVGLGRLDEPDELVENIAQLFYAKPLNRRVLITSGPTRSPIDPVRYLTNKSSGLMGSALAHAACQLGYDVTVVSGPVEATYPKACRLISVETSAQMAHAVLESNHQWDIFIGAAAVLDWEISNPSPKKLKKESGAPQLELEQTLDILYQICLRKTDQQFVLGFAAETDRPIQNASRKLIEKGCDAIFVNDVSQPSVGFGTRENAGWWVANTVFEFQKMPKIDLAMNLFQLIEGKTPKAIHEIKSAIDYHPS